MPKFSVVIAVFNKEDYIAKTLQSVLEQTEQDFELLVLNDGSTDESELIIQPFVHDERIHYFNQENRGIAAARNFLIEKSNARFIAFLDADDLWYPNYLAEQQRLIQKYPKESVFAVAGEYLKNKRLIAKEYSVDLEKNEDGVINYFESSLLSSVLHSSSFVVKKEVFSKVGRYNTRLKTGEDTDLYVRIGLHFNVAFSSRICAQHRVLKDSLSKTGIDLNAKASFKEYEGKEVGNPALKKFLDLNRFSICVAAKLYGDKSTFQENYQKIDMSNLNGKQRFLIGLSRPALKAMLKLKSFLSFFGIRSSAFK